MKTKYWIIIIVLLALLFGGLYLVQRHNARASQVAEIWVDGTLFKRIDLSQVKEAYTLVVGDLEKGSNTILVEPGRIRVLEADCPDLLCEKQGWLPGGAGPIVCLPHKLIIRMGEE